MYVKVSKVGIIAIHKFLTLKFTGDCLWINFVLDHVFCYITDSKTIIHKQCQYKKCKCWE